MDMSLSKLWKIAKDEESVVHEVTKSRTQLSNWTITKYVCFLCHLPATAHRHRLCVPVCLVTQSCPTVWDPVDCNPPGSSFHGILQARILEWVAISFSRGSSWPRDRTWISLFSWQILYHWATWEALHRLWQKLKCYHHFMENPETGGSLTLHLL